MAYKGIFYTIMGNLAYLYKMTIYLILYNNNVKNVAIEYCVSLQKNIKNSKLILYPSNELIINKKNLYIFFGVCYTNYQIFNKANVYFVNIEQLTMNGKNTKYDVLSPVLNLIKNNNKIKMMDYSLGNISILKKHNIDSMYIPYQVNYDEIFNYDKIYNFATCCTFTSRTKYIYDKISLNYIKCNSIGNPVKWGIDRDNILFKTRVLANIHYREVDYDILEEIRLTRCILNKIIVVSEYSYKYYKYPLAKYIIFVKYKNMVDKIKDVLDNYDKYYYKIYNNFDINAIDNQLKNYLDFLNK